MFFFGDFLGDFFSIADTPTNIEPSSEVNFKNGKYDAFFIGQGEHLYESETSIPEGFDEDTIMRSDFNDSANAGNVDWSTYQVDTLTIQRRKEGTNNWVVIESRKVDEIDEFKFSNVDTTAASNTRYEYAVIPYFEDTQGEFNSAFITSKFNGIFLVDRDMTYGTPITDGMINTTRNIQRSFQTPLNRRYPVSCGNSINNYDTGDCTATWLRFDPYSCQFELNDSQRVPYQHEIMDWLTNGQPKILKSQDGRIWLIEVNPSPTDNGIDLYNNREITFQWTEIGDANNDADLFYAGLIKADEYWWRNG